MTNNSHLTAIKRNKLSAPAAFLSKQGLILGKTLDYGCGRGKDVDILKIEGYDKFWQPIYPQDKYDTILCTFVLNVVDKQERQLIINDIKNLLNPNGRAYLSVRRDLKKEGITSKSTLQFNVNLDYKSIHHLRGRYEIYLLSND